MSWCRVCGRSLVRCMPGCIKAGLRPDGASSVTSPFVGRPHPFCLAQQGIHPIWVMRWPNGEDRLVIITRVKGARWTYQSLWCAPGALDLTPEH
jgi:hypothetical protein